MLFWLFPMWRSTFSVAYNLRVVNFFRSRYREEKWWRHKNYICELTELFSNIQIKKTGWITAPLPQLSLLAQIGEKMFRRLHLNLSKIGLDR